MKSVFRLVFLGLAMVALGTSVQPVFAHHSGAGFNSGEVIELKGSIKEVQFKNPHSWVQILVPGADGNVTEWSLEWGSPNSLARQGYRPSAFPVGAKVTVRLNPTDRKRLLAITDIRVGRSTSHPHPPVGPTPSKASSPSLQSGGSSAAPSKACTLR